MEIGHSGHLSGQHPRAWGDISNVVGKFGLSVSQNPKKRLNQLIVLNIEL